MMMESRQVALVTGASSGIGQATAELLAARGFTVFGTSREPSQVDRLYRWLAMDVRSDASVEAAVQSLVEQAGRIDVLVNNAGFAQVGAIEESSIADVQAQFDLRAATTRPRLRYLIGRDVKVLMLFKRLLPQLLFERLQRRVFRAGNRAHFQAQTETQETAASE
jgi:NAD(P)-dependent dehydrogenase (short-subunit alcohol dehydrogenase family)